jgi:uncharacterized protein
MRFARSILAMASVWLAVSSPAAGSQAQPPELVAPVNDFARVIDPASAAELDRMIRILQGATSDVVVVATINTIEPFADVREYAVKMFENRGRGIGVKGRDNGLLVLLAVKERQVRVEVGYELESFITDGFAGETSRQLMAPLFKTGEYGQGLKAGVQRIIGRIAEGRNVKLEGMPVQQPAPRSRRSDSPRVIFIIIGIIIFVVVTNRTGGGGGTMGRGWRSGVGPFGGGFGGFGGGGFGGGGGGGGFGGFGGGGSGGGGGGASW